MSREDYVIRRIEMTEEQLNELKTFISRGEGEVISLSGVWEGVDFTDKDVAEAKRSLFKGIEVDDSH